MAMQKHPPQAAPVLIAELPPAARFSLRVGSGHKKVLADALGLDLPAVIGDCSSAFSRQALCLGPDEWLVLAPEAERHALASAATEVYAKAPHSLCEISDREISLRLSGPEVLTALATGCPRDIGAIAVGSGVRTLFDNVTVILWRDGEQEFRMDVWRSFLPHVRMLLDLALLEIEAGL